VASTAALARPSLESSWQVFLSHLPIFVVIGVATSLASGVGMVVTLPLSWLLGGGGGGVATPELSVAATPNPAASLAALAQLPFGLLSGYVGVLNCAVPALHYASGRVISINEGFGELLRRPRRYVLAGLLFAAATWAGLLACLIPGLLWAW